MKDKKAKQKRKNEISRNKLIEKREKLKELDLDNDEKRKIIIKRIKKIENNKKEIDKKKDEKYQRIKEKANIYLENTKNNKNILEQEENEIREDILDYENYKFNLALEKEMGIKYKRNFSQNQTIENQKETNNRLKEFKKIMSSLYDESVTSKNDKQKRLLYNEKVKKDMEIKKKEEELKLEKLRLI